MLQNSQQENELLSTKTLRLEDNIEDLKSKLSGTLTEKDRLLLVCIDLSGTLCCCLNIIVIQCYSLRSRTSSISKLNTKGKIMVFSFSFIWIGESWTVPKSAKFGARVAKIPDGQRGLYSTGVWSPCRADSSQEPCQPTTAEYRINERGTTNSQRGQDFLYHILSLLLLLVYHPVPHCRATQLFCASKM